MRKLPIALGALLFGGPVFFLALSSLSAEREVLAAFLELQVFDAVFQTFGYGSLVALLACVFGGAWGYVCASYEFPGRRLWLWLLPAPLAVPVYVYAFVYLGIWQSFIGYSRPAWLLVVLFSLAASPYAYLLSFQAFRTEPKDLREASELMGLGKAEFFRKVRWPLAFPLLVSGFFVVLAEFISDFGAVQLFGLRTFSTSIYSLWTAYLSFGTAALVSLLLLGSVGVVLFYQSRVRSVSFPTRPVRRQRPRGAWWLTFAALVFTTVSFTGPVLWLVGWALAPVDFVPRLIATGRFVFNTALLSSVFAAGLSLVVSMAVFGLDRRERVLPNLIQFGYAMPGTILAVAVTVPFFFLQRGFSGLSLTVPFALSMMFFAWSIRLMKVAWEPIAKNRAHIPPALEEAATIYEPRILRRWRVLLFPLLKTGALSSVLFLFLEAAKELPIALLTRPLGWETLSIKVFEYTAESEWKRAATPALLIVMLGCLGLAALMKSGDADA